MNSSLYDQVLNLCMKGQMREYLHNNIPNTILFDYDEQRLNFLYNDLIEGYPSQEYTPPTALKSK